MKEEGQRHGRRDGERLDLAAGALGMQWQVAPWIVHARARTRRHTKKNRRTHTNSLSVSERQMERTRGGRQEGREEEEESAGGVQSAVEPQEVL